MRKPIIGVLPLYDREKDSYWMLPGYMKAIEAAGGIPVMLPMVSDELDIKALSESFDGFLFTGGHDINPLLYGEEMDAVCGELCRERDVLEQALFQHVVKLDKPAFGICRGLQLFNVLLGGTLYQDLPTGRAAESNVEHQQRPPYSVPVHSVTIHKNSLLYRLLEKETIEVNSYHHQAIKALAPVLQASALSEDGLVEAVEMPGKTFLFAVQWHPEFNFTEDDDSMKMFRHFVASCS
ncbi:gamma-glutamyl-gamma-aminobutyrate hydrolase family protein [Paenibacillus sp. CAU 1782]